MSGGYKFERLYEKLLDMLLSQTWDAGDRFHSEAQLCLKYNVSRQTIRKAVKMLADNGYLVRKQGSGTYVTEKAVARRNTKTNVIGILVTYLSDYIFPVIIKELEKEFTRAGYSVQLASSGNSSKREGELLAKMLENQVDGIILEPTRSAFPNPNIELYRELLDNKYPLVTIHSSYEDVDIPTVALDDKEAGRMATDYLFSLNHQKIGAILKSDDLQGHRRYKGILKAHSDKGLYFDDKNVYWYTTEDIKTFSEMEHAIIERLKDCTAVVCYNDQIGIEYEKMLENNGLSVPGDQSIVSIDNSRYAELAPVPLSSVESPITEIGRTAAWQLLKQIHGEKFTKDIIFRPEMVKRRSAAPLKSD